MSVRQANGSIIYQCVSCEMIGRKWQVINHALKSHVAEENVPFYCTLCKFRCQDLATLMNHVSKYKRHLEAVTKGGPVALDQVLMKATAPIFVDDKWIRAISRTMSLDEDPLSEQVSTSRPGFVPVQPAAMVSAVPGSASPAVATQAKTQTYAPVPEYVPTPITPVGQTLVSPPKPSRQLMTPLQDEAFEDLLPGLFDMQDPLYLGVQTPAKRRQEASQEPPAKRRVGDPLATPPINVPVEAQASEASAGPSTQGMDGLARIIEEAMTASTARVIEAMDRNTRAVIGAIGDLRAEVFRVERKVSAMAARTEPTSPRIRSTISKPKRK